MELKSKQTRGWGEMGWKRTSEPDWDQQGDGAATETPADGTEGIASCADFERECLGWVGEGHIKPGGGEDAGEEEDEECGGGTPCLCLGRSDHLLLEHCHHASLCSEALAYGSRDKEA